MILVSLFFLRLSHYPRSLPQISGRSTFEVNTVEVLSKPLAFDPNKTKQTDFGSVRHYTVPSDNPQACRRLRIRLLSRIEPVNFVFVDGNTRKYKESLLPYRLHHHPRRVDFCVRRFWKIPSTQSRQGYKQRAFFP